MLFFGQYARLVDALDWRQAINPEISHREAFGELCEIARTAEVHARARRRVLDSAPFSLAPTWHEVEEDIDLSQFYPYFDKNERVTGDLYSLEFGPSALPSYEDVRVEMLSLMEKWRLAINELEPAANNVITAVRRDIPKPALLDYLLAVKEKGGRIPAADLLYPQVIAAFPQFHVSRLDVRTVAKEVWGEQPRGRRRKSAT